MEDEWRYMCPRPRRKRACNPCKERKIRCLSVENIRGAEICRRCEKLGIPCDLAADTQPATRNSIGNISKLPDLQDQRAFTGKDIVSELFQNQSAANDDLNGLYDIHCRAFQPPSVGSSSPDISGYNNMQTSPSDSSSSKSNVAIEDAETLLDLFRNRQQYFPFVVLSENASASSMAVNSPFLLMAILNVCSSRVPSLQQRADERFRRVLSERIVFQGEKNLDYLQGLLVYIAWYPFHFKPLSNQVSQFLQIALNMCIELKLTPSHSDKESRDACLGCYNLSAIFCTGLERPRSGTATWSLGSNFNELAILHQEMDLRSLHTEMQITCGRMVHFEEKLDSESILCERQRMTQEKIQSIHSKLEQLASHPSMHNENVPINLSHLFLKAKIAFLPLKAWGADISKKRDSPLPQPLTSELIEVATPCFQAICDFLDDFLAQPMDQYLCFTTREWFQLILTTRMASRTCFFCPSNPGVEWSQFQARSRAEMANYLKSLSQRMDSLSSCKDGGHADIFFMFKSVLDLLAPKYAAPETSPQSSPAVKHMERRLFATQQESMDSELPNTGSSSCPILNGSIRGTEFWRASQASQSIEGRTDPYSFDSSSADGLFNGSREWLNVFSQWVVDLNDVNDSV